MNARLSPLMIACADERELSIETVKTLLERGANPNQGIGSNFPENVFRSLLNSTRQEYSEDRIEDQISRQLTDRKTQTKLKKLSLLIDYGLDFYQKVNRKSLMRFAFDRNEYACMKLMIDNGLDLNKKYSDDMRFLREAIYDCNYSYIKFLLENGAKVFIEEDGKLELVPYTSDDFRVPLFYKLLFDHVKTNESKYIIDFLVIAYAINDNCEFVKDAIEDDRTLIEETDCDGDTILANLFYRSEFYFDDDLVVCKHEKSSNGSQKNQRNPRACDYNSYVDLICYLIDNGSDILHRNNENETAFSYLCRTGNVRLMETILEKVTGIKIGTRSYYDVLAQNGQIDFLKDMFMYSRMSKHEYNSAYNHATPEVKDFMERWTKMHEELLGKGFYSFYD